MTQDLELLSTFIRYFPSFPFLLVPVLWWVGGWTDGKKGRTYTHARRHLILLLYKIEVIEEGGGVGHVGGGVIEDLNPLRDWVQFRIEWDLSFKYNMKSFNFYQFSKLHTREIKIFEPQTVKIKLYWSSCRLYLNLWEGKYYNTSYNILWI